MSINEEITLTSTSPLSFESVKVGDRLGVAFSPPKPNEYRSKIGKAQGGFLLFRGQTKVGMIPRKVVESSSQAFSEAKTATVVVVDSEKKRLVVLIDR